MHIEDSSELKISILIKDYKQFYSLKDISELLGLEYDVALSTVNHEDKETTIIKGVDTVFVKSDALYDLVKECRNNIADLFVAYIVEDVIPSLDGVIYYIPNKDLM